MTVAELIKKLEQLPPDLPVVVHDRFGDCIYLTKVFVDYDRRKDEQPVAVLAKDDD